MAAIYCSSVAGDGGVCMEFCTEFSRFWDAVPSLLQGAVCHLAAPGPAGHGALGLDSASDTVSAAAVAKRRLAS